MKINFKLFFLMVIMIFENIKSSEENTTATALNRRSRNIMKTYNVNLLENRVAVNLIKIEAPENARFKFAESARNELVNRHFEIHSTSGIISVIKPVDFETVREIQLTVQVDIDEYPPIFSYVNVNILNEFDSLPLLSWTLSENVTKIGGDENSPVVEVMEPVLKGRMLATLILTMTDTEMCRISAKSALQGSLELLEILNYTYAVLAQKTLDREEHSIHSLEIWADELHLCSFVVHLKDINDHAPVFEKSLYSVTISENILQSSPIVRVKASDPDIGINSKIKYKLQYFNNLRIDENTGDIWIVSPLDREENDKIELTIIAQDGGGKQSSATLCINIHDENDNAPVFDKALGYFFEVPENEKNIVVGTVKATDSDHGKNAEVRYGFKSDVMSLFEIGEKDGVITTVKSLDREERDRYDFDVWATDNGMPPRSAVTRVSIKVSDKNDNAPIFLSPGSNQTFLISGYDESVLTVNAIDKDSGLNGQTMVSMSPHSYFKLQGNTLMCEKAPAGNFVVRLIAYDLGFPKLFTYREVNIRVLEGTKYGSGSSTRMVHIILGITSVTLICISIAAMFVCIRNITRCQNHKEPIITDQHNSHFLNSWLLKTGDVQCSDDGFCGSSDITFPTRPPSVQSGSSKKENTIKTIPTTDPRRLSHRFTVV